MTYHTWICLLAGNGGGKKRIANAVILAVIYHNPSRMQNDSAVMTKNDVRMKNAGSWKETNCMRMMNGGARTKDNGAPCEMYECNCGTTAS